MHKAVGLHGCCSDAAQIRADVKSEEVGRGAD
jgi:hypothetical protein